MNDNKTQITNLIQRGIRTSFLELIYQYFEQPAMKFKTFGVNITNLSFWLSTQANILEYSFSLFIIEDIFESYPIEYLENLFDILEKNLKNKPKFEEKEEKQNGLILLRIANSVLKRLSSSRDTQFRGKVQMMLASIFQTDDKSGVNLKGLYNTCNYTFESKMNKSDINFKFYKQFWILHRYLTNPFQLFTSKKVEEDDFDYIDESSTTVIMEEGEKDTRKLEIFFTNINKILSFFENHLISYENTDSVLSYPKYLTSQDLFDLQLQDSSFRKTILIQFLIVLRSFLKPVTVTQKKLFFFTDNQKKQIKELLIRIKSQLNEFKLEGKGFFQRCQNIFRNEEKWENWKEANCKPYEIYANKDLTMKIKEISDEIKQNPQKIEQTKYAINIENQNNFNFNSDLLKFLNSNFQDLSKSLSEDKTNSYFGTYLEKVYNDDDQKNEIEEEYKSKNEPVFKWKFLRLIAQNEIHKFEKFNDGNVDKLSKDYLEKYGKIKPAETGVNSSNLILPVQSLTQDEKLLGKKTKSPEKLISKETN